mgnify:CR=1 FL=1
MLTVRTIDLGRVPYRDCWEYQQRLFDVLTAMPRTMRAGS